MRMRRYFAVIVLLSVPLGMIIFAHMKQEAKYNGKSATEWFRELKPLKQSDQIDALRNLGKNAVPTLKRQLQSPDPNERYKAVWALGQIGPAANDAVQDLVGAMDDTNNSVRYYA